MRYGEEHFRQKEKHRCIFQGPNVKSFVPLGTKEHDVKRDWRVRQVCKSVPVSSYVGRFL